MNPQKIQEQLDSNRKSVALEVVRILDTKIS